MSNSEPFAATDTKLSRLSLWDAVSLIVGIVVGSSIYRAPPTIFANAPTPAIGLGLWLIGGVCSLIGALIYAELATTYPRCGGEYVYLSRAFGPGFGFLFAWSQLVIIQTASIGAMAYVFADYALGLFDLPGDMTPWLAGSAVLLLTLVNLYGLRLSARVQNVLTILKLLGLGSIIVAGICFGRADPLEVVPQGPGPGWTLSLILILYAYGGWSDAGFVAAEVRDTSRNIPRALLGGLGLITLIYLGVNFAYLKALGPAALGNSERPAAETLALILGPRGGQAMSLLVMASTLGAVNGLIFSASRVYATLGEDYRLMRWLRGFSRSEAPLSALIVQALVTTTMIFTVGTSAGQTAMNRLVTGVGFAPIDWSYFRGGFETLVAGSAPAFWTFFVLNGLGFLVLRWTDRDRTRSFHVPGSPITPLIFVGVCGWMLYSSATYAASLLPVMSVPILFGIPVYLVCQTWERRSKS